MGAPMSLKAVCISVPDADNAVQWRIPNFSRIHVTKLHSDEFFCGGTPWYVCSPCVCLLPLMAHTGRLHARMMPAACCWHTCRASAASIAHMRAQGAYRPAADVPTLQVVREGKACGGRLLLMGKSTIPLMSTDFLCPCSFLVVCRKLSCPSQDIGPLQRLCWFMPDSCWPRYCLLEPWVCAGTS